MKTIFALALCGLFVGCSGGPYDYGYAPNGYAPYGQQQVPLGQYPASGVYQSTPYFNGSTPPPAVSLGPQTTPTIATGQMPVTTLTPQATPGGIDAATNLPYAYPIGTDLSTLSNGQPAMQLQPTTQFQPTTQLQSYPIAPNSYGVPQTAGVPLDQVYQSRPLIYRF
jgi:hypothetical protein